MAPQSPVIEIPVGRELIDILKVPIAAQLPFLVEGEQGIGKSEILQELAHELGLDVIVLDLSLLEPSDLIGMPIITDGRTVYALPSWCPTGGSGLLVLEELNRCEVFMRQPALQLLSARRLGGYELPPGWSVAASINPEDGDYQVARLDPAVRGRFLNLRVCGDLREWRGWAERNGGHPAVLTLAREHERLLETVPPRTWTKVSSLLHAVPPELLSDEIFLRRLLSGYLCPSWSAALITELGKTAPRPGPSPYEVLRNFERSGAELMLQRFYRDGDTDSIDELVTRLEGIVGGPELGTLDAREAFDLDSFEATLHALPGDQSERLQEAFARNELSSHRLELTPDDLIDRYGKRAVSSRFNEWNRDGKLRHRAWALGWAVPDCLRRRVDLAELKGHAGVRRNLGKLAVELGDHAEPLLQGLKQIGITPLFSKGSAA